MKSADLITSSKRWMRHGLEAFGGEDEDVDFAIHHAGVALEHLLKAYLASHHPVLIVDGGSFDSVLHSVGLGANAQSPLSRIKTIGVVAAFTRSRQLLRSKLVVDDKQMLVIAAARNGVAHVGIHERAEVEESLATCFRIADVLLMELGEKPDQYWATFQELHDQLVKAGADRLQARYQAKIAKAKALYLSRFESIEESSLRAVIDALDAVELFTEFDKERAKCPACSQQGWLAGDKRVEADYEPDGDGGYTGGAVVVLTGDAFECAFCKLELDEAELTLTDIETVVETDDDVNDYLDYYEPDEDLWRDR